MKVSELINELQSLPQNAHVLCYTEDENLQAKGHMFRLLDIEEVSLTDATPIRGSDELPSFKLGKSETSEQHVLISVVSEF